MNKLASIVIDRVENGIIVIDQSYKIVLWNKWLEHYSNVIAENVIGQSVIDVVPLFGKSYYKQIFDNALFQGQSMFCSGAIHSVFVQKKDQTNTDDTRQNMRVEPIEFEGNTYVLLQINDITIQYKQVSMLKKEIAERQKVETAIRHSEEEMKRLKDEALQASRAKSDFLAIMSHEIRTPMNAIIGMAELLQETKLSKEQNNYVSIFQKSGENLLRIINDILDISKIESGKTEFVKKPINLPQFLEEVVATYSFQAKRKGLAFTYSPQNLSKCVTTDPTRLYQIISNVISNAIKFTEEGMVTLEVETIMIDSNKIQLQCKVIDTGIGIPKEKRDIIFERFTQVDSSTTRKFGGTGLGLTIVKRLVEEMNGQIEVEGDSSGTTFIITVELDLSDNCQNNVCNITEFIEQSHSSVCSNDYEYHILIAEDSPDNYKLLQAYLKNENMNVHIVENGYDAVAYYEKNRVDLIIMDIEMPVMDGLEATKAIRKLEKEKKMKQVPIIALTAHALGGYEQKTMEAGCNLHLIKPIKKQEFLEGIYKTLTNVIEATL